MIFIIDVEPMSYWILSMLMIGNFVYKILFQIKIEHQMLQMLPATKVKALQ
jgi:hypothetical protein